MQIILKHCRGGYLRLVGSGGPGQWCYTDDQMQAAVFVVELSRETGQLTTRPPLPFDLSVSADREYIDYYPVVVKTEGL